MSEEQKTHKIAIVTVQNDYTYDDNGEYIKSVVEKYVTDWAEVSRDDLKLLSRYLNRDGSSNIKYYIIEDQTNHIPRLVSEAIKFAQKKKEEEELRLKKRALTKMKREAKKIEDKRKLLSQLKEELGETN